MLNPWNAREICPFCFESFRLRETPFRCQTPEKRCGLSLDEVRVRVWDDRQLLAQVIPADGKAGDTKRCPHCQQVSHKRLCPACHMELPHTVGKVKNLILAVIGAKEAGKSHYIAVLIEQLKKRIGPALGMALAPQTDETIRRYRDDFYKPIYQDGLAIRGTVSALTERRVQQPMVFTLTFGGKDWLGRRTIRNVVTLVFFDTAGEDLNHDDVMATVNKYIYRADGLIILLDPLQLRSVRARLDTGTALPEVNTETETILTRTSKLISIGRSLGPQQMITTPLAVVFSKFDAVEPLIDPQLQINSPARHEGGFDLEDFAAVQDEMQALLVGWEGESLQNQVESHFRTVGFFGLTALGCNPRQDKKISHVLPRRVEDPFLWLLYQHKLIPGARQRSG